MTLEKIVSGGQTGVDRGALNAAIARGFPCGGWCPPGRIAEDGIIPHRYVVSELSEGGYRQRTLRMSSTRMERLSSILEASKRGTEQTLLFCIRHHKPYKLIDGAEVGTERAGAMLRRFVDEHGIRVLNVAGPRLSREPGSENYTERAIGVLLDSTGRISPGR